MGMRSFLLWRGMLMTLAAPRVSLARVTNSQLLYVSDSCNRLQPENGSIFRYSSIQTHPDQNGSIFRYSSI